MRCPLTRAPAATGPLGAQVASARAQEIAQRSAHSDGSVGEKLRFSTRSRRSEAGAAPLIVQREIELPLPAICRHRHVQNYVLLKGRFELRHDEGKFGASVGSWGWSGRSKLPREERAFSHSGTASQRAHRLLPAQSSQSRFSKPASQPNPDSANWNLRRSHWGLHPPAISRHLPHEELAFLSGRIWQYRDNGNTGAID